MSDHIVKTIEDLSGQLRQQEDKVTQLKRTINDLCGLAGLPKRHPEADDATSVSLGAIRSDSFYGRPLATVIREYLQMRKAGAMGAASVNEIYDALTRGGYAFDTKDPDNAKRGLRASLSKNPAFHKVPTGDYGLTEWYPAAKEKPKEDDEAEAKEDGGGASVTPKTSPESPAQPTSQESGTTSTKPQVKIQREKL